MKKKKTSRHFFRILSLLFAVFMIMYILLECGYYESKLGKQSALTKENIKQFEKDIKEGKAVDLNSYTIKENVDYSNTVTKVGNTITNSVNTFMTEGLSSIGNMLKKLFW